MILKKYGFNEEIERSFIGYKEKGYDVGRVIIEHKHIYRVITNVGEVLAEISGKIRHNATGQSHYPAVGDWVIISVRPSEMKATIHGVLPRKSKFCRKVAGIETSEQIIAANFETVFIINSLNKDFNIRRIERFLTMAWESGGNPVIILSKADLCHDIDEYLLQLQNIAVGIPIHVISSYDGRGLDEIRRYCREGKTIAILGSSGVGKSTLINCLAGEQLLTVQEIREVDDKGRHTTTHRQLILLEDGGLIIDTPGMREFQLWDGSDGVKETFRDIEELVENCYFNDCSHKTEAGCGIIAALESGALTEDRLKSYEKLQREIERFEKRKKQQARINERKSKISKNKRNRSFSY